MRLKNLYENNLVACDWLLQYSITVPSRVRRSSSATHRLQRRDGRRTEWAKLMLLRCPCAVSRECFADLLYFCLKQLRTSPKACKKLCASVECKGMGILCP